MPAPDTVRRASDGRALCQECSDPIEWTELRVQTAAGLVHTDCAPDVRVPRLVLSYPSGHS